MKLIIDKDNFKNLPLVGEFLKKNPAGKVTLSCIKEEEKLFMFSEATPYIYRFLDSEVFFEISLQDFPYCALDSSAWDHVRNKKGGRGEKNEKCNKCPVNKECNGFPQGYFAKFGDKELSPIFSIPDELKIEVESRCNFDCIFCFNKASFAQKSRDKTVLDTARVKKIMDQAAQMGVKTVRFTGGEPLLRKDIFALFVYAKTKGLYVKLNTNASLITDTIAKKMEGLVDNVLISLESYDDEHEQKITRHQGSFSKKIRAVNFLKKAGIPMVRISTVALSENIENFDTIAKVVIALPFDEWEWYRPISMGNEKIIFTNESVATLVKKIEVLRKKTNRNITIGNDIPYCSIKNSDSLCRLAVGSRNNLIVDPRVFVKSEYYADENFGSSDNLQKAWNSPKMKQKRSMEFLPRGCQKCKYKLKCRGGNRYEANLCFGKQDAPDPLMKRIHPVK